MTWTSPFHLPGRWLKGNLHTHTTQSDGQATPEEAIGWYRGHGYDFLAISDHWVRTVGEPLADDFITLTAAELDGPGYHMLTLGLSEVPERDLAEDATALADEIVSQGGLAYFAHPYWTDQTSQHILKTPSVLGIEVFNSVCDNGYGLGDSSAQWDEVLSAGMRATALAVDDVHWGHGCQGRGWVMVHAEELSEAAIFDALRRGTFYASTGPVIADLSVVEGEDGAPCLNVRCSACETITFYCKGPKGHRFRGEGGATIDRATWPILAEQGYIRVACTDAQGHTAWTQPLFVEDVLG